MVTHGSFGFKIGKKTRLMSVHYDSDLLWQTCVREIYILMKHYGSIEAIKEAFTNLKDAKGTPKKESIKKCQVYTDLKLANEDWSNILRHCQHSFINILDSGYFLNDGDKQGLVFIFDFNTNEAIFNGYNWNPQTKKYDNIVTHKKATVDEIMEFEDMPTKSLTEIMTEMNNRFAQFNSNLEKIYEEKNRIQGLINKAKELGSDHNILERAKKLMDDMDMEKTKLCVQYRIFYYRMDALNLIDHTTK
jgi:hypothetical protein